MIRIIQAPLIFLALCSTAYGQASFVLCSAPNRSDIIIELNAITFGERTLSCLSGGDGFIFDMTPCAPDGGYGLSAPTGSASLVGVVDRWQDYGDHSGGVVAFGSSSSHFRFLGGFHFPGSGYSDQWSFEVSRLTGVGILRQLQEVEEAGERGYSFDEFSCAAASQLF